MIESWLDALQLDFDFSPVSQVDTRIINKQQCLSIKHLIKFRLKVFDLDLEFKISSLESSISYLIVLHLESLSHFKQFSQFQLVQHLVHV